MDSLREHLIESHLLQDFVRASGGSWSPGDWVGLILKLNWSGFKGVPEGDIRKLVADNCDWWLKGENTLSPKRRTDPSGTKRKPVKMLRQSRRPK